MFLKDQLGRTTYFYIFVTLLLTSASCSGRDLSTPEKTIATYYKGYLKGDKSLTEATLLKLGRLEDVGFRPPIIKSYRVIKIQEVIQHSTFAEIGDVEVVTEVQWKTGHPPQQFWFLLRKSDGEWKIAAYSALPGKDYPPMP